MQRDFDLVVTILGALRDAPGPNLSTHDIKEAALAHEQGLQLVAHHLDLLADAGLVKQVSETAATARAANQKLTAEEEAKRQEELAKKREEDQRKLQEQLQAMPWAALPVAGVANDLNMMRSCTCSASLARSLGKRPAGDQWP